MPDTVQSNNRVNFIKYPSSGDELMTEILRKQIFIFYPVQSSFTYCILMAISETLIISGG